MAAFDENDLDTVKKWLADPNFSEKLAGFNINKMKNNAYV